MGYSLKVIEQQINIVSSAISSLINVLSNSYQMRFHIVAMSGDEVSKRISDRVLSKSQSEIHTEQVTNITQFIYLFGVPYIIISQRGLLLDIVRRRIPEIKFIERHYTSYGHSMLLNYAYGEDIFGARDQTSICTQKNFPYQPYQVFQLSHTNVEGINDLLLFNCVMFQEQKCEPEWKIINSFSYSKSAWKTDNFIAIYRSFNYCEISCIIDSTDSSFTAIMDRSVLRKTS